MSVTTEMQSLLESLDEDCYYCNVEGAKLVQFDIGKDGTQWVLYGVPKSMPLKRYGWKFEDYDDGGGVWWINNEPKQAEKISKLFELPVEQGEYSDD